MSRQPPLGSVGFGSLLTTAQCGESDPQCAG